MGGRKRRAFSMAILILILPVLAYAGDIIMNGVEMDSIDLKQLSGKKFRDCTVLIDAEGRLHIDVPGVKIMKVSPDEAKKMEQNQPKQKVDGEYYLASDIDNSKQTGFEINIYINGRLVKQLQPDEERMIMRMNKYLHRGKNTIRFVAHKKSQVKADSSQKLSITFGEGRYTKGVFEMYKPYVLFEVNAAQNSDVDRKFELELD